MGRGNAIIGIILLVADFLFSNLIIDKLVESFPEETFPTPLVLAMKAGLFVSLLVLIIAILSRSGGSKDSP